MADTTRNSASFEREQDIISCHISKIFNEDELNRNNSLQKMHKSPNGSNPDEMDIIVKLITNLLQ